MFMKTNWVAAIMQTKDKKLPKTFSTLLTRQENSWQCLKMRKLMKLNKKEWRYSTFYPFYSNRIAIAVVLCYLVLFFCSLIVVYMSEGSLVQPSDMTLGDNFSTLFLCFLLWIGVGFPKLLSKSYFYYYHFIQNLFFLPNHPVIFVGKGHFSHFCVGI